MIGRRISKAARYRRLGQAACSFGAALSALSGPSAANEKAKSTSTPEMAHASAGAFADCIVKKRVDQARAVVLESTYDVRKRFPKLLDRACLPDKSDDTYIKMRFPGDTLHQSLADALIRLEFASSGPDLSGLTTATEIPVPQPTSPDLLARMSAKDREKDLARFEIRQTWSMLATLGDCVSRRDPEGVRRMALTHIESPEEKAAISNLQPQISACWPVGQKLHMRFVDFRGPTVLAYYHLARLAGEIEKQKEAAQ